MIEATATPERDPLEARFARAASGRLRQFNEAGVLHAADVHVARRLGRLADERDETVLLAVALAVRAPRLGHVHVDLQRIRDTAAVDTEDPVDLATLDWPDPAEWTARVAASPLVGSEDPSATRPLRLAGSALYLDRYWAEEVQVADALRRMSAGDAEVVDEPLLADGVARLFPGDTEGRPARAAATAVRRRFAVVAGGPGTGKTTTVARIVALLCEQAAAAGAARPPLIALAAPTGKAAARLEEAVHAEAASLAVNDAVRRQLLELSASTIHRLLGWRPGTSSRFRHDAGRRLPHDVVIIDETSMVPLSLMARLIEALRSRARLVLVGDPAQLASIEAGAVLGDIVAAATPGPATRAPAPAPALAATPSVRGSPVADGIVVLDRVHRFGGGIARVANAIRAGEPDAVIALLREQHDDVTWLEADPGLEEALPPVREPALQAARVTLEAAAAGHGGEALTSLGAFRILCAHRRGPYGVAGWTARMESWLASEVPELDPEDPWYVGRPLLVTQNDHELRLNNGDTGVVVRREDGRVTCAFARGGEIVHYGPSRLGPVETVYAMTIHKSQGSQFEAAAVLLPDPESRLLTRELLYTAVTRAQRRLILVGTEEAVRTAVGRPVARASGLAARLRG